MIFPRIYRYLFPALAYGGLANLLLLLLAGERLHGYEDPSTPGEWVVYFDIHHHHWSAAPTVAWIFVIVVIVPAGLSILLSFLRPDPQPASFVGWVASILGLLIVIALNACGYLGLACTGWNARGSF